MVGFYAILEETYKKSIVQVMSKNDCCQHVFPLGQTIWPGHLFVFEENSHRVKIIWPGH